MRHQPCYQVDAFTERPFAGNPAAVCPLSSWLSDELMQDIAAENALSETAFFVRRAERFELRWFTPTTEVELCGHATLASAFVILRLLEPGLSHVEFDSKSGPLRVARRGDELELDFPLDATTDVPELPELEQALGQKPCAQFKGRFTFAVLESAQLVRDLKPNISSIAELPDVRALCVTAPGDARSEADYVLRVFAPRGGIPEDPVTGSAQCGLAPYWAKQLGRSRLRSHQLSRRGGQIGVTVAGSRVLIAGHAVLVKTGELLLPEAEAPDSQLLTSSSLRGDAGME
jgi:PhzF family phenazine biosynthesis protein